MIIRLVYSPSVDWEVHRFDVSAPSVLRAINMIDAPKEVSDGDLIIHEANSAYICNQGMLKAVSMEEVAKMRPPQKCTNCALSTTALNTCVQADKPQGPVDILFLGMAPGREEDIEKVSFVETAPAAKIIKNIAYNEIGIPRNRVAWTNITKCFPTERGVMRDPSVEEMLECSGTWLWDEIIELNPKLIVVFGGTASQFLLQNEIPITKIRGSLNKVTIRGKNFPVLPCIHPSSVAHGNREFLKAIRDDMNLAWSIVNSKYNEMPQCHILNDTESIIAVCKKVINLYNEKVITSISLDIESDYLHKELDEGEEANKDLFDVNHTIVGFAISWDESFAVWFTLDHAESKVDIPAVIPYIKEMLELVPIEAHHGKYDQSWLKEKLGISTVLSFDTMLGSFALHGQSRSHGLKPLLRSVFSWPPYETVIAKEVMSLPPEKRSYRYVPLQVVGEYCCYDTAGTRKLVAYQKSQLSEIKLELAHLLSRTSDTLMKAELNGVPIDLRRVKADNDRYNQENGIDNRLLHEHEQVKRFLAYKKSVNPKDPGVFNPNSPNDVKAILFGLSVCNDCKHTSNTRGKKNSKGVKEVYPYRFKCCPACNSTNTTDYDFLYCDPKRLTNAGAPSTDQDTLDDLSEDFTHRHVSLIQGETTIFCKECRKDVEIDDEYHINFGKDEVVRFFQLINRLKKRGKIQQYWKGMEEYYRPVINEKEETALLIVNYRQTLVVTGRLQASNYSIHTLPASCLTGDTKIRLLDGNSFSIKDLKEKYKEGFFWVYSLNDKDEIVPGKAHSVRITGKNQPIYKVMLDNGNFVKCTKDHLFRTKNGYIKAEDLKYNQSLSPLYTKFDDNGYELVYNPNSNKFEYTHILMCNYQFPGISFSGMVRHHKDFNKHNNNPDNFELIEYVAHRKLHNENASKTLHTKEAIRRSALSRGKNPKVLATLLKHANSKENINHLNKIRMLAHLNMPSNKNGRWKDSESRNNEAKVNISKYNQSGIGLHKRWHLNRNIYDPNCEACIIAHPLNHKVVSVEFCGYEDVYDLTVDKYHNFGLDAEVFVHNSDIRRSVVAKSIRRGGLVLNADYAQVEPRILASVAKCEGFIQIFKEGRDIYRGAASSLLKIADDEVSKTIREFMKAIFLGITYGKSDKAVARDCGVPLREAQEFINNLLYKQFPELGQWIERTHKEVRSTGKIESVNGRVYFIPDAQLPETKDNIHKIHTAYRHAQNYGIQGPASDVTCEAATQIVREIERQKIEAELFGLIHDQLVTGIGPGTILPMLKTCDYAMKELAPKVFPWVTVPLNIELETGPRFDGGVIVTEYDDNSFTCKGMENFFDELIETTKLGYNKVTVEVLKKEKVKRKEEILIKKAYNGDKGGDHEIKARVYLE